jgi:RNA polymerase sigma factor (sigma-70 family)
VPGTEDTDGQAFEAFVNRLEPRLHSALVAAFGYERGRDAAAEALAYAWEHWDRVEAMSHPLGYLYRVGQTRTRTRKQPVVYLPQDRQEPQVEPGLLKALASLPERQRVSVVLVHGNDWTLREVAEVLGISVASVQKHAERGLASLRRALRVEVKR